MPVSVPPKTLKNELRKMNRSANIADNRNGRSPDERTEIVRPDTEAKEIARRAGMDLAEQPENLPVLEAFQEFLDHERRRARKNLVTVSVLFLLLILAVIGAGGGFAYIFMQKVKNDVGSVESRLSEAQNSWKKQRKEIESSVSAALADTRRLEQDVQSEREALKQIESTLESRAEGTDSRMMKLARALVALKKKSDAIRSDMAGMRRETQMAAAIGKEEPGDASRTRQNFLEAPIALNGSRQTRNWRIPIPE